MAIHLGRAVNSLAAACWPCLASLFETMDILASPEGCLPSDGQAASKLGVVSSRYVDTAGKESLEMLANGVANGDTRVSPTLRGPEPVPGDSIRPTQLSWHVADSLGEEAEEQRHRGDEGEEREENCGAEGAEAEESNEMHEAVNQW